MSKLMLRVVSCAALALALVGHPGYCAGSGDLLVTPTRVVFEGKLRMAEVTLINTGDTPATYRITLTQRRMTELGGIEVADTALSGDLFATGLVRISPAQIILKPQEAQAVRLQLRLPADLGPGEYRSHLQFNGVPDAIGSDETGEGKPEGIGVMLKPIYGVSIPVIIRRGDLSAELKLTDLNYTPADGDQPASVSFTMNRSGTMSTYGDLIASLQTADGKSLLVGRADGVAVYCPNATRRAILRLDIPSGTVTAGASLSIGYFRQDGTNVAPWAQESLALGQ
jgi:hypothetical protein